MKITQAGKITDVVRTGVDLPECGKESPQYSSLLFCSFFFELEKSWIIKISNRFIVDFPSVQTLKNLFGLIDNFILRVCA